MLTWRLLLVLLAALLVHGCAAGATSERQAPSDRQDSSVPPARASGAVRSDPSLRASGAFPALHPSVDGYPDAELRLIGRGGQAVRVAAKVANTPSRRRHGLMEVPALPDGVGMLFVFPDEQRSGFWMKDTLMALDIAFVGRDGSVNRILRMDPCTGPPCPVYDPGITYLYALEVRAGWFEQVGVDTDWKLELPADLAPASDAT